MTNEMLDNKLGIINANSRRPYTWRQINGGFGLFLKGEHGSLTTVCSGLGKSELGRFMDGLVNFVLLEKQADPPEEEIEKCYRIQLRRYSERDVRDWLDENGKDYSDDDVRIITDYYEADKSDCDMSYRKNIAAAAAALGV